MPDRWKSSEDETPPLDRMRRCDHLWLYDDAAVLPRVVRGLYAESDVSEGPAGEFTTEAGDTIEITHWTPMLPQETRPPAPPQM
ncbi:hypothetical protein BH09VER1_BH09VER1_37750 [soil metagenome]